METIEEWRGIRRLMCAEVITDTADEFTCGTPFQLAGVAEISRKTEASSETKYYDNGPAIVIEATGSDEVTITCSALSFENEAKITGQKYNSDKGMFVEGQRKAKYFAIGYIAEKTTGEEVFVWRLKGKFNIPDKTHVTKDNGTGSNGMQLIYTGIETNHRFADTGEPGKAVHLETKKNPIAEEDFFGEVQTPDTIQEPAP